jgi:DNA-binding NtrC family response regulator
MPDTTLTNDLDQLIDSWLVGYTVVDIERELILRTFARQRGCRTRAARDLKISVRTLRNKINEYKSLGVAVPAPGDYPRMAERVADARKPL